MKRILYALSLTIAVVAVLATPGTTNEVKADTEVKTETKELQIPAILEKIAYCESGNSQTDASGNILRGSANPLDLGRFQINTRYHLEAAEKLGFDLYTSEGNTQYAIYLYNHEGTDPWNASKACWGN